MYLSTQYSTSTDYYPFGMVMPGRSYTSSGEDYRFGFQGQEKNSDLSGVDGGHLDFKYRIHDARLGRFLSMDPLLAEYPWNSPYAFSENRVIDGIDLEGLEFYKNTNQYSIGNPKLTNKDALFIKASVLKSVGFQNYVQSIITLKMQSNVKPQDGVNAATTIYDNLVYPAASNSNKASYLAGKISGTQTMRTFSKLWGLSRISAVTGVLGELAAAYDRGAKDGMKAGVAIRTGEFIKDFDRADWVRNTVKTAFEFGVVNGNTQFQSDVANFSLDGTLPTGTDVTTDYVDKVKNAYSAIVNDVLKDQTRSNVKIVSVNKREDTMDNYPEDVQIVTEPSDDPKRYESIGPKPQ